MTPLSGPPGYKRQEGRLRKALGVDSGKRHVERHHAHRARPSAALWRNVGPFPGVEKVGRGGTGGDNASPVPAILRATVCRTMRTQRLKLSRTSCSQNLITAHPLCSSLSRCRTSRALLSSIFSSHQAECVFGNRKCRGHPCQKQPSTNTHTLAARKTMSALQRRSFSGRE